ncbi:OmpA family protein [Synechococcus sp. PCC 7336]|uniref:OmpA family protein n=1 Tax=Synechococcus sp. PCC 7336 TaxID=195250 RepID=UPI00138B1983|nr:OmpA family protein [Synechococcus sp. PCC 7336]
MFQLGRLIATGVGLGLALALQPIAIASPNSSLLQASTGDRWVAQVPNSSPDSNSSQALQAEIRAIRQEIIQLLTRLEALETQVAETGTSAAANASGGDVPTTAAPPPADSDLDSFSPVNSFNDPTAPQIRLGTQTISLPGDVLFDFNQSAIKPEAASLLEQVVGILAAMPFAHIQVAGHTDNIGDPDYNLVLSVERATSVQEFLKQRLPDAGQGYRWTTTGHGAASPVADNGTETGRQRNRRVDLIVSPQ